jgi:hypothetical protein
MGTLMGGLPEWAQQFAHETNTKPLDEMRLRLKDVDRLGQTLRRLIQEKSQVKTEQEAASGSGSVKAEVKDE